MATRFYPATATPAVAPSSAAAWDTLHNSNNLELRKIKNTGSSGGVPIPGDGVSGHFVQISNFVSLPLQAQSIGGTIKGQWLCVEANASNNYTLAVAVRLIKPDGTERAVLLAPTASDDTSAAPPEMATSVTNRRLLNAAESAAIALTTQSAQANDRLCVEVGFRQASTDTGNCTLIAAGGSAGDLPENDTATSGDPWIEFSGTVLEATEVTLMGQACL